MYDSHGHLCMKKAFIILQYIVPQRLLTRLIGLFAASRKPWIKDPIIALFIKIFQVDMSEALEQDPRFYESFNAFFTRPLRAGIRPLTDPERNVLCPADGAVSQLGKIQGGRVFQAKGQSYSTLELLGGQANLAELFENGSFATIYLSPRDYHRVHMPVSGILEHSEYIPGDLFSVNRVTAENVPRLFARNERQVTIFDSPQGKVAVVLVGAMIVRGIEMSWKKENEQRDLSIQAGEELGRFYLGSTAIVLFQKDKVEWQAHLKAGSPVRMGEPLGSHL